MNKYKNRFKDKIFNFKQFVKDNKKQTALVFGLIFSLGIYFVVFAADADPYSGKIVTTVDSQVKVEDGLEPFDSDDLDGNDSSSSNNIVRNFDTVKYNISYKIDKDESIKDENVSDRNVVIDILIPDNIESDVKVSSNLVVTKGKDKVTINDKVYNYYEADAGTKKIGDQSNTEIYLSNINHISSDASFSPIFQVRESTENVSSLANITEINSNNNHIVKTNDIKISEKESYIVKAFAGNIVKNGSISSIPIGVLTYLPYDSVKGIKGLKTPNSLSYNISTTSSAGTLDKNPTIDNYIEGSNFRINQMPYNKQELNGVTSISEDGLVSTSEFTLNTNNIYKEDSSQDKPTGIYLTSNVFVYNLDRSGVTGNINIESTAAASKVTLTSYESDVVGDLITNVSYYDVNSTKASSVFNYGEEFNIVTKFSYINSKNNVGDTLNNGMVSYIKFDNSAINILQMDDSSGYNVSAKTNSTDSYDSESDPVSYSVKYAVGSWDKDNWQKKKDAPSTCPSIDNLSREQIMNLYGGPCIEPKVSLEYKELAEISSDDRSNIIVGKFEISKVYTASTINVTMKGKIISSSNIVGNTYQTVVSSTTDYNDSTYYLGEIPNNATENEKIMINKDNYIKSSYINGEKTEDSPKGKYGSTLLVSAVKTSIDSIKSYSDDVEKNRFTAGADDPIIWKVNATARKNSIDVNYNKALVYVYIPSSLIHYQDKTSKVPISVEDSDNGYKKYTYEISKDEISDDGTIKEFSIYTNIAPEAENNTLAEIIVQIDCIVDVKNGDVINTANSVDPIENRTKKHSVTIVNNRKVSLNGTATPQLLEINSPYTYTMKAYNNSGNSMNLELINVLPTSDSSEESFDGTYSVKINNLPENYTAYYIDDINVKSGSILSVELSNPSNNNWKKWDNSNIDISGIKAIKIVPNQVVNYKNYFGSSEGITITITPKDNKIGNEYINSFGIIDTSDRSAGAYMTGNSVVSIYNRRISGYVFEDFDYDGLYGSKETKIKDLSVELYKLNSIPSDFKEDEIVKYISEKDTLIDTTSTDKNGNYTFKGLEQGYYYVKIKFDSEKYTVSDYEKKDNSKGDTTAINSKFKMLENNAGAVSKVLYVDNNNLRVNYVNLGLKLRQVFGVNIEKYITNVKVISNKGTNSYDYNKAKKVKVDVKDLKNTKMEVTYKFEIENSEFFPGYVGTIVEAIPNGMKFDSSLKENYGWSGTNGILYYSGLSDTLIMPGEKYYFQIKLILEADQAGDYINVISAGDLKLMETFQSTTDLIESEEES